MAAASNYLANKLLDHMRGVTSFTMPTVWVALCTTTPTATVAGTEATYTGYARVPLAGLMGAAASGSGTNSSVVTFAACTAGSSAVTAFQFYDAATAGNPLEFGACSLAVSAGITPQFAIGTLTTTQV